VSCVDQAVIDLVEGVSILEVPGLEVDSIVHEECFFDRHLPAFGKVDLSEAIFICTLMQAVLVFRWLMHGFPANFCVLIPHHQLHVMTWTGCIQNPILMLFHYLRDLSSCPSDQIRTSNYNICVKAI
jgi:hypothetical protein